LTSVSDFAGRSATLTYDGSGRLTKIVQPDPDGVGPRLAPETDFTYDPTSHKLTKVTDPLDNDTQYECGTHERLEKITFADLNTLQLFPPQTFGLPLADTGNDLAATDPDGSITDERGKVSNLKTDRFGKVKEATDELGNVTRIERDFYGLPVKLIAADPENRGPLASPVTIFGYDAKGNQVYRKSPRGHDGGVLPDSVRRGTPLFR